MPRLQHLLEPNVMRFFPSRFLEAVLATPALGSWGKKLTNFYESPYFILLANQFDSQFNQFSCLWFWVSFCVTSWQSQFCSVGLPGVHTGSVFPHQCRLFSLSDKSICLAYSVGGERCSWTTWVGISSSETSSYGDTSTLVGTSS